MGWPEAAVKIVEAISLAIAVSVFFYAFMRG